MDDLANLVVKKLVKGGFVVAPRGKAAFREECWESKPKKSKQKCGKKRSKGELPEALAPYAVARSALKGMTMQPVLRNAIIQRFAEMYDFDLTPDENLKDFRQIAKGTSPIELLRDLNE